MKSLYDKLKQKKGEGSKIGEFNASKGWCDNFRIRFGFKNVKIKEKQHLPTKTQQSSQMPFRKSLRRKDICLDRFLKQMKLPCSGGEKKMPQVSKEEKQHQLLRQEGTD